MKRTSTFFGQKAEFLNVKFSGSYNYCWVLNI